MGNLKHGRKNVRQLFFTGQESSDDRGPPLARLTFFNQSGKKGLNFRLPKSYDLGSLKLKVKKSKYAHHITTSTY